MKPSNELPISLRGTNFLKTTCLTLPDDRSTPRDSARAVDRAPSILARKPKVPVHLLPCRPLSPSCESISPFLRKVQTSLQGLDRRTHFLAPRSFFFSSSSAPSCTVARGARDTALPPRRERNPTRIRQDLHHPWINRLSAFSGTFQPLLPLESPLSVGGGYLEDLRISEDFEGTGKCLRTLEMCILILDFFSFCHT